jgi:hypothetical protein
MTDTAENTFTIPMTTWHDFTAKIDKLNKRARKLGCEPITFTILNHKQVEYRHTFKNEDGEYTRAYMVDARTVALTGMAPKLEGFAFIAKVEYLSDDKSVLFHTVPGSGVKIDERFRSMKPHVCEHCNKSRVRRETFIVQEIESGRQMQVGRQCLADFTGITNPEAIAQRASWLSGFSDLRDFEGHCFVRHFESKLDTMRVLSLTSAYIANGGWVPRSANLGGSTASDVGAHFVNGAQLDKNTREVVMAMGPLAREPAHQDRAARVIDWIKNDLAARAKSDYELNLVTLVAHDLIERKHLGIVCSAVAAYQRAMNQKIEYAKRKEAVKDSQHVGEIGKRFRDLPVRIEFVKSMQSDFGASTLVKFVDDAGNLLTWFASGDRDNVVGARATITGTVKKHGEYQGIKETQLSRVVAVFAEEKAVA